MPRACNFNELAAELSRRHRGERISVTLTQFLTSDGLNSVNVTEILVAVNPHKMHPIQQAMIINGQLERLFQSKIALSGIPIQSTKVK